jgi:hypothetical protein
MPAVKERNYAKVLEALGVSFGTPNSSGEALMEECPWCGREKFYLNVGTGLYHCKHCDKSGNVTTFLTWIHGEFLDRTTAEDYSRLGRKRGVAPQTLERHQLACAKELGCWLIPFKNAEGNVFNLMRYYPDKPKPNKFMLPELPAGIYGFDKLVAADKDKPVLLCEGPFDAIALDFSIGHKHRSNYVIVATPGAFSKAWVEHFRGRKVRALYDNDGAGRKHAEQVRKLLGESGMVDELLALKWPDDLRDGYDINDLVKEHKGKSVLGWLTDRCYKVTAEPKLVWVRASQANGPEPVDWIWPNHLRCGTYASFSGRGGTLKSTIAAYLVAEYTTGRSMPTMDHGKLAWEACGLPPGHVLYVTAEDGVAAVTARLQDAKADMNRVDILPATLKDGQFLNVLEHLPEIRSKVRELGVRFVVIDGQNSVVGAPCITTDMLARHNVTNPCTSSHRGRTCASWASATRTPTAGLTAPPA